MRQLKASASNVVSRSLRLGSTASLVALPAMSLIPFAPFSLRYSTDDVPEKIDFAEVVAVWLRRCLGLFNVTVSYGQTI